MISPTECLKNLWYILKEVSLFSPWSRATQPICSERYLPQWVINDQLYFPFGTLHSSHNEKHYRFDSVLAFSASVYRRGNLICPCKTFRPTVLSMEMTGIHIREEMSCTPAWTDDREWCWWVKYSSIKSGIFMRVMLCQWQWERVRGPTSCQTTPCLYFNEWRSFYENQHFMLWNILGTFLLTNSLMILS